METRFLLPGRRMCLCQGKGVGREACGEEMEMLVRWGPWGLTGSLLALQPVWKGLSPQLGTAPAGELETAVLVRSILRATL